MPIFLSVAAAVFLSEMGDKTQLLTMSLAAREKKRDIILGVVLSTVAINFIGVYLGAKLSCLVRREYTDLAAGALFLIFSYLALSPQKQKKESKRIRGIAFLAIAAVFFTAELGDKTQLSAMAFAAGAPGEMLSVFGGACLGMFLADGIALAVGIYAGGKIPEKVFSYLSSAMFFAFGIMSVLKSAASLSPQNAKALTVAVAAAFLLITALSKIKIKNQE